MPYSNLAAEPPDPLLMAIGRFRADPREDKIDLGVGVYRTEEGLTPVMRAVKAAERRLLDEQQTKAYVGPAGDLEFVALMRELTLGNTTGHTAGIQTAGGTAAVRVGAELLARAGVKRVHVGTPAWAIHIPLMKAAGLIPIEHRHFDPYRQRVDFEAVEASLSDAEAGDAVLLQASCHNPTGCDFSPDQWKTVADVVAARGLTPLIDIAYQGLGEGLAADVAGARRVLEAAGRGQVAVSCSKSFGLYRERTGAAFAVAPDTARAALAESNMLAIARMAYSMPPDHGAAAAKLVLQDEGLRADWQAELADMRGRITALRARLSAIGAIGPIDFAPLAGQKGMFSLLPLTPDQIRTLRERHAVHLVDSGRANLAGLSLAQVDRLGAALVDVLG